MLNRFIEWIGLRAARDKAVEERTLDRAAARCKQFAEFYSSMNHGAMVAAGAWSCHEAILELKEKGDDKL